MSKDKKTKEKSTKKALIILISALAICFLAGYIVGKIMGKVEKTQRLLRQSEHLRLMRFRYFSQLYRFSDVCFR